MITDVRNLRRLRRATGWQVRTSRLDTIVGAELWFGREGIIPDEWTFAKLRSEVAQSSGMDMEERIRRDYAQEVAFEQSRFLSWTEATELRSRIESGPFLHRCRVIRQHGPYWEDAFLSDLAVNPWPIHLFGDPPVLRCRHPIGDSLEVHTHTVGFDLGIMDGPIARRGMRLNIPQDTSGCSSLRRSRSWVFSKS